MEERVQAQKVTLERISQIFEEREKEFRLKEENIARRQTLLSEQEQAISEKMDKLRAETEKMDRLKLQISEKEKALAVQKEELDNQQKQLEKDKEAQENILIETAVLREEQRNEVLKLERIRGEYEEKLSLIDPEKAALMEERTEFPAERDECQTTIKELQEEKENLQKRVQELETENEVLSKDKQELLKKLFSGKTSDHAVNQETPQDHEEVELPNEKETAAGSVADDRKEDETAEELTAAVLHGYLKRTEPEAEVAVRHSDQADQILMRRKGLDYYFVFDSPAYYDIRAKRKKDRRIRKAIEQFNGEQMGVKFSYDDTAGEVVATGYFTTDISPYSLVRQIYRIVDQCFDDKGE